MYYICSIYTLVRLVFDVDLKFIRQTMVTMAVFASPCQLSGAPLRLACSLCGAAPRAPISPIFPPTHPISIFSLPFAFITAHPCLRLISLYFIPPTVWFRSLAVLSGQLTQLRFAIPHAFAFVRISIRVVALPAPMRN